MCGNLGFEQEGWAWMLKWVSWAHKMSQLFCVASFHRDLHFAGWFRPLTFMVRKVMVILRFGQGWCYVAGVGNTYTDWLSWQARL